MTTTQSPAERIYRVSQIKIHYGRENDVTGIEDVPESQLYRELEARGVQRRLWSYEDGTSQTVNGEFVQWELMRPAAQPALPFLLPAANLTVGDSLASGAVIDARETAPGGKIHITLMDGTELEPMDPGELVQIQPRRAVTPDPEPDLTTPLLMAARGLKPGMAVIDGGDGTTVHTVLSVVTEGTQTTVEFVGGVAHVVPDIEGYRVTRLSAMAVYHSRQAQRSLVAELAALADSWDNRKGTLSTVTYPYRSYSQEDCAEMLRELLARLQA